MGETSSGGALGDAGGRIAEVGGAPGETAGSPSNLEAGAGGAESSSACSSAYSDWFRATFPYPDGGILGTADFPSSPWRTAAGTLATKNGAASSSGNSRAIASQGLTFDYGAARARFKVVFTKSEQTAALRLNADGSGDGGLSIHVSADTGEVAVLSDDQPLATKAFGAIELNAPAFVQAVFSGASLSVTLSVGNYAEVPGSVVTGTLEADQLEPGTGTYTSIELGGTDASVDDISYARCGAPPPKYKALLRDTFDRADSATPGNTELPAAAPWTGDTDNISIGAGALRFSNSAGGGIRVAQGLHYPNSGLRFRSSAKFDAEGWFYLNFNGDPTNGGGSGFDLYREKDTNVFIEYAGIQPRFGERFPIAFDLSAFYFMQFDVQDDVGVVTVRSGSYDGPILFGSFAKGFVPPPVGQASLSIGNTWSSNLTIDEIYVDRYAP